MNLPGTYLKKLTCLLALLITVGCSDDRADAQWDIGDEYQGDEPDVAPDSPDAHPGADSGINEPPWYAEACDEFEPAPVEVYRSEFGDWSYALSPSFEYTELTVDGADASNRRAVALFETADAPIVGFLMSQRWDAFPDRPSAVHAEYREAVMESGTVSADTVERQFTTHDGHTAMTKRYSVETTSYLGTRGLHNMLLFDFAPFERSDVSPSPPVGDGRNYSHWVDVTVVRREHDDKPAQVLSLVTVTRTRAYDRAMHHVDALINTTTLAARDAARVGRCTGQEATQAEPSTPPSLAETPISASLRARVNGQEAPHNWENGFHYNAARNAVLFTGDYRLGWHEEQTENDRAVIAYDTFVEEL